MYMLFKAKQANERGTAYYIAKDYNDSTNNYYDLFYNGWTVLVYIQVRIYIPNNKQHCLLTSYNEASNDEASYEELLDLIDVIVKASSTYTPQILDLLNSILINWDVV